MHFYSPAPATCPTHLVHVDANTAWNTNYTANGWAVVCQFPSTLSPIIFASFLIHINMQPTNQVSNKTKNEKSNPI